ncbi:exosortase A [Rhodoferax sp.]|uniref:exosortase A n=1 Tax=Rhodoferax sp. TaxID=50421 RepID=UPI0027708F45|nr:exosortase A [Rhodoferax sp.]
MTLPAQSIATPVSPDSQAAAPARAAAWRNAIPQVIGVIVAILLLYRETALAMVTIWYRSETFTHAFVVPPLVAWLIWRKRAQLALLTPQAASWVLLPMAGAAFVWLLGDLAGVNALTQLALVTLLVLTVPALLGLAVARCILFALLFLFFAVPLGEFMMPQMMAWTADFTVLALRLSGIPVFREGLQFVIPSGNWSVVEACSGIRYLIASVTVGTLFAYLNYQSTRRRLTFVLVSLLVPIVANWLRAYIIVMLGHLSGNKLAVGADHLIYGWAFFGVVIMLMFMIGARWSEPEPKPGSAQVEAAPARAVVGATKATWPFALVVALLALVAAPHGAVWMLDNARSATAPSALVAPSALAIDWRLTAAPVAAFEPAFNDPSASAQGTYRSRDGKAVGLYLGYYRNQDYQRKLISSDNVLVRSKDPNWNQVASGSREIQAGTEPLAVRTAELRGASLAGGATAERLVVWQIYWINGTITASDYLAKAYSAWFRLTGRGDDSAVIIVYTTKDQVHGSEALLQSFLSDNLPAIEALLAQTRQGR